MLNDSPPGVTVTVAPGGVVYCFDFQVAVLDRKNVEEKFEARSDVGW